MTFGNLIDAQGVELRLNDGDLIDGILVLARVRPAGDEEVRIGLAFSEGMDWITQFGLLEAARRAFGQNMVQAEDD